MCSIVGLALSVLLLSTREPRSVPDDTTPCAVTSKAVAKL